MVATERRPLQRCRRRLRGGVNRGILLALSAQKIIRADAFLHPQTTSQHILRKNGGAVRAGRVQELFLFQGSSATTRNETLTSLPPPVSGQTRSRSRGDQIPSFVWRDLFAENGSDETKNAFGLPYQFNLLRQVPSDEIGDVADIVSNKRDETAMEIRLLRLGDIPVLTEMCYQEYGSSGTTSSQRKRRNAIAALKAALESVGDFFLRPFVILALLTKLLLCTSQPDLQYENLQAKLPQDHVVLVLSMIRGDGNRQIVGWVDVSRQVVRPNVNPNFFPLPKLLATPTTPTQAWITNLLVAPEFRGQGWAKVLVGACEAIARSWPDVTSIHLHCDANPVRGEIAQQLYTSLGYEPLCSEEEESDGTSHSPAFLQQDYMWMGEAPTPQPCSSSIYVIDGVPLLYLRKTLN